MTPAAWLSCVAAAVIAVSLCLPGAGGGNRTGSKDDAARVNAASGEGATPRPPDVGEEPRHPIAGSRSADGRGASVLSDLDTLAVRLHWGRERVAYWTAVRDADRAMGRVMR